MKYVIVHKEWGIYLGSFIGLGFWTKLDPVGQTAAAVFDSKEEAEGFISHCECEPKHDLKDFELKEVKTENEYYATLQECVAAGLEGWEVGTKLLH